MNLSSLGKLVFFRAVLIGGLVLLSAYLLYRISFINFTPSLVVFSLILFLAELHTIFHLFGMFYCLWPRNYTNYAFFPSNKKLQINIFICVCGEPADVVYETIEAAKIASEHYFQTIKPLHKPKVIVLNDGKAAKKDNWKDIERIAKDLGVYHVARSTSKGFKAGNINYGIKLFTTRSPKNTLDIILDSDFSVKKHFLIELAKPFRDNSIDFAQSPQRYKNETTWVAKAAAAHQIFFFDHICSSKGHDNALFLCGTNFAIRRSALHAIGGMDTRFITEDYATSLELHLIGKKGVFVPEVLAEGIAPSTLKAYYSQQQRWAKGSFDVSIAYLPKILFGNLSLQQKFHYMLSATYYLIGIRDLILMLAPLPYLFFGISLIKANTIQYLIFVYLPLFVYNFILYTVLFRNPIKSIVLDIASFPVFVAAFISSILKRDIKFIVTIKKYEKENPFDVYKLQLLLVGLLAAGFIVASTHKIKNVGSFLNYFWAGFDLIILSFGFYLIVRENYSTTFFEKLFFKISHPIINLFKVITGNSFAARIVITILLLIGFGGFIIYESHISLSSYIFAIKEKVIPSPNQEFLLPYKGVYYGYYQPNLNSHPENPKVEQIEGEKSSLTMFYQDWTEENNFDSAFLKKLVESNHMPIITWEPWDSNKPEDSASQKQYSLQSIIDGKHDAFIHQWAADAAEFKHPFFLRLAHEMNGNWYPWGNSNSPETYVKMWKHVHDIFIAEGARNVVWLWSPNNTDEKGESESILSYYPGDNYVDWVGFSGFNWGTLHEKTVWKDFKQIVQGVYDKLKTVNKPIIVAETSTVDNGGNKLEWFKHTIQDIEDFPKIKAIIFFNEDIKNANFGLPKSDEFNEFLNEYIVNNSYFNKNPIYKTK